MDRDQRTESLVCQYENSSNGDLLADVHPAWPDQVLLVGARVQARSGTGPRFSLATKGETRRREVH